MLPRSLAFAAIVGLLASQLAALPHAHSWTSPIEQQKHDSTPHVHLEWLGLSQHRHEHSHGGHTHSHAKGGQREAKPIEEQDDTAPIQNSGDHKTSAIVVSVPLGLSVAISHQDAPTATSQLLAGEVPFVCQIDLNRNQPICWHPPDLAWADSHLYLSLRNLRI